MAMSTPNYGLHQWAPWQNLRRETFNQNHSDIDAALKGVENRLAAVGHDLYGALLQSHYDGKVTDWKQSLFFDGLRDKSLVAQASDCLFFMERAVVLCRYYQGDINLGYAASATFLTGVRTAGPCTSQGYAQLTGIRLKTQVQYVEPETADVTYQILINRKEVLENRAPLIFEKMPLEQTITFSKPVPLHPGDSFQVQIHFGSDARMSFNSINGPGDLGGTLLITPACGESGSLITPPVSLPCRGRMWAWARFNGGEVSLSATGDNTDKRPFTVLGDRSTVSAAGAPCIERAFFLKDPPASDSLSFTLDLALKEDQMKVQDYGILLL